MRKKALLGFLLFLLFATPVFAQEPTVASQGAVLMDGRTGRILWGKNEKEPLAMASTTKIMTAILVLEHVDLEDVVLISKNAAHQPEVHMDLKEAEQWKVIDLLSAMMLRSYNDAAVALAEHCFGSVEAFCGEMTKKAKEIGAEDTVFGSPNGLDSHLTQEQHHSTAYDMALIAGYALQNEQFRQIITQQEVSVADLSGKHLCHISNANRFLREYQGAIGVKTGYTNRAGHCFVGAAEKDGVLLISTVLGSGWGTAGKQRKWTDTKALMEYGFATFQPQEIVEKGTVFGEVKVTDSPIESLETVLAEGYEAIFSTEEAERLWMEAVLPKEVEAPVEEGERIGKAILWLGEEKLTEIHLLSKETVPSFSFLERLQWLAERWLSWRMF